MGKAVIVTDKGLGLYDIRLDFDMTRINAELEKLKTEDAEYYSKLYNAQNTVRDIERSKDEASDALNEVVKQWVEGLISKMNEVPPTIPPETPNDPDTGLPWTDLDKAMWGPLFERINAARTANSIPTVTRNSKLDKAIQKHLRTLSVTGYVMHDDGENGPAGRAWQAGYDPDLTVGVGQILAFGQSTPDQVIADWLARYYTDRSILLNSDYVDCGVGYLFASSNSYTYLWGATFATPGPPLDTIDETDPAKEAEKNVNKALENAKIPETDLPDKIQKASAELARATQRLRIAKEVVQQLMTERLERLRRIAELESLKTKANQVIEAWTCAQPDSLGIGDTVYTAELPGFYLDSVTTRTETFIVEIGTVNEFTRTWEERPIQIIPPRAAGRLRQTLGMTPAQVFHAAAMEPGMVRWRPLWRWGTITAKSGDLCDVTLDAMDVRQFRGVSNNLVLDTAEQLHLTNVQIVYPPCNGQVFLVGDEVLILYQNQDRTNPRVIGFRYGPRLCPQGRQTWRSV